MKHKSVTHLRKHIYSRTVYHGTLLLGENTFLCRDVSVVGTSTCGSCGSRATHCSYCIIGVSRRVSYSWYCWLEMVMSVFTDDLSVLTWRRYGTLTTSGMVKNDSSLLVATNPPNSIPNAISFWFSHSRGILILARNTAKYRVFHSSVCKFCTYRRWTICRLVCQHEINILCFVQTFRQWKDIFDLNTDMNDIRWPTTIQLGVHLIIIDFLKYGRFNGIP